MTLYFSIKNGNKIKTIVGELMNIKVTEKKGFEELKKFYMEKAKTRLRIGNGFDVHGLRDGGN